MSRLFKRGVSLELTRTTTEYGARRLGLDGFVPTFDRTVVAKTTDTVRIDGLRVTFSIEKTLKEEPNDCSVTIYNLAERSRAELQRKPINVRLDAGYDGNLERVFAGDLRWAESRREGVDWITKLQLGDGERAFRHARVSRTYTGSVSVGQAVAEIAKSMGLAVTSSARASAEFRTEFVSGLSIQGASSRELTRILQPFQMQWSIQDGRLQILKRDEARVDEPIIVSQDTGLIGSPEYGAPESPKKKPILSFRMLLYPGLTPGSVVDVRAKNLGAGPNRFKVVRCTLAGDTHSNDFASSVEAVAA